MSLPRWQEPNLARAPFVNERPVRRLAVALWLLFAIVGAAGLWMSQTIRRETGTLVAELTRLNAESVSARERATALETELRRADLPAQNVRTEFLNRRIAERSFSWNRLLETLTFEMPRGVRLMRLSPEGFTRERGRASAGDQTVVETRVALRVTGEAEETEALLEFVDRLFQHPAFDRPNLSRESGKKDFKIQFELSVDYLPRIAEQPATTTLVTAQVGSAATPSAGVGTLEAATRPLSGPPRPGAGGTRLAAPTSNLAESVGPPPEPADKSERPTRRGGSGMVDSRGSDRAESARESDLPPGSQPGGVGDVRRGAAPAPAAAPGPGRKFPFDVLPTPLKSYASSAGGQP